MFREARTDSSGGRSAAVLGPARSRGAGLGCHGTQEKLIVESTELMRSKNVL